MNIHWAYRKSRWRIQYGGKILSEFDGRLVLEVFEDAIMNLQLDFAKNQYGGTRNSK